MLIRQSAKEDQFLHKDKSSYPSYWLLTLFSILVLLILVSYNLILRYYINNSTARAEFGDMHGAIDTLFSGLAFAGIIYTIHQQRKELRNTEVTLMNQIELQRLNSELTAIRHEIDIVIYDVQLKISRGTPPGSINLEQYEKLRGRLQECHKAIEKRESEMTSRPPDQNS